MTSEAAALKTLKEASPEVRAHVAEHIQVLAEFDTPEAALKWLDEHFDNLIDQCPEGSTISVVGAIRPAEAMKVYTEPVYLAFQMTPPGKHIAAIIRKRARCSICSKFDNYCAQIATAMYTLSQCQVKIEIE